LTWRGARLSCGPDAGRDELQIHVDGGSAQPGRGRLRRSVQDPDGRDVARLYGYLGVATNNVAEYQASSTACACAG
jgi:ribonuclease HI